MPEAPGPELQGLGSQWSAVSDGREKHWTLGNLGVGVGFAHNLIFWSKFHTFPRDPVSLLMKPELKIICSLTHSDVQIKGWIF